MDYPYFTAAPQPYQFLGLPATPAPTGSAISEDFSNSPPVRAQPSSYVSYQSPLTPRQDAFDQYQPFDYNQFAPNGLPPAKPPTPQLKSSTSLNHGYDMASDMNDDPARRGSNSDDDENMTPAQSRRKAQNRAAYVPLPNSTISCLSNVTPVKEPFASVKNAMSKISRINWPRYKRIPTA